MKGKVPIGIVALAVVTALVAAYVSFVRAQPVASIALPAPRGAVDLYPGCNNIALSFPDGTACDTVVEAVTPAGVVGAMWRHDAALNKWDGFSPAAPQASDLKTVNLWDAVWLCIAGAPPPAPTAPPPSPAAPTVTPPPPATATPMVAAANDVILVSSNAFTTTSSMLLDGESRRLHIVGELRNDSSTLRSAGKIMIAIYDGAGNVAGQRWDYAFDDLIRPGRTTAFHEEVPSMFYWSDETGDYPEGWATYEITLSSRDPYSSEKPPLNVTVHDVQASIGDYDWLYIRGTVRNDDSRPQKWSGDVYAILYDGDDKILNASTSSFDALQPGQSTEFEIKFYDDEPIDYSRYLVQAYAEAE